VVASLGSFGAGWNEGVYTLSIFFMGLRPGSIGETSTLMCLIGAAILIATGAGSWKIIVSVFGGAYPWACF
jgi:Na+-transporting NADH:ubiquinone oxidoreductase subunit B